MRRFRNNNDKELYNIIYNTTINCIKNNKQFSDIIDDKIITESINSVDIEKRNGIVVNGLFDAIGFSNKNLKSTKILNESLINSGKTVNLYNCIYESVKLHKKTKKPVDNYIDEGLIAGALGALAGISFGPAIGKAICDALGIGKGVLYDLMTSKLVNGAVCTKLGLRF